MFIDTDRPVRFCSNPCLISYHSKLPREESEPTPIVLYMVKNLEKAEAVWIELQAMLAMRELTGTDITEEDLEGLRWLATHKDPVVAAVLANLPLPPGALN